MISKKRFSVFLFIMYCVSICYITFGCACFKVDLFPNWPELFFEASVKYECYKKSNNAYVYEIYRTIYDKDLQKYVSSHDFDENIETIVIPETVKDGQYKVVGLYARGFWDAKSQISIAPRSWKNIKKIYFPYTMWDMYFLKTLMAGEGAYYDGKMLAIVPNIGSKQRLSNLKETFLTYFKGDMFFVSDKYLCGVVPQKHYDMVVEQYGTLETQPTETVEEYVQNLVTPNYVFTFNYEGAPNEGIYWIDLIQDENTPYALPTVPTREGYTFGGWYTEDTCVTEWDNQMTPTTEVKTMYAKWIVNETVE